MIVSLLLCFLGTTSPLGPKPRLLDLDSVLDRVRTAVGYGARAGRPALELLGSSRFQGITGDYRVVSTRDGRFRVGIGGRLGEILGYDGQRLWRQEQSGAVQTLQLEELDRHRLVTWIQTGHWLHESRPLSLDLVTTDEGQGVQLDVGVRGTPMRMRLEIDARTWLPHRLSQRSESGLTTWVFEDYAAEDGFRFPRSVTVRAGEGLQDHFEISGASWIDAAGEFQAPQATARRAHFSADAPAEIHLERTFTGHLLVQPEIDGRQLWFLLDSGAAALVIHTEVADELKMKSFGEVLAVGGSGRVRTRYREGKQLCLGPLTLEEPVYLELDIAFLSSIFGVEVAGICGYDVFAHAVVEMEPAKDYAAVHDPATFELEGATWQGLILDERIPCVEATFEGDRRGLFKIDTGADGTVTFHGPAVARFGLLQGRRVERAKTGGVGGFGDVYMGRLDWFELGPRRFESPTVAFSGAELGSLSDEYTLGNLGQGFLSSFRLVFDYPNGRLALRNVKQD